MVGKLGVFSLVCLALTVHATSVIESTISVEADHLIHFSLLATEDVSFLSWATPMEEGLQQRYLKISAIDSANHAQWTSRSVMAKRMPPTEEHFVSLSAGEIVRGTISLEDHYDIHAVGSYVVRLEFPVITSSKERSTSISNEVVVEIREAKARREAKATSVATVFYNECTNSEISLINAAIGDARAATSNALDYFDTNGSCIDEYVQWFGTYGVNRFSNVEGAYENILSQLLSNDFGFDCTCNNPDLYAYVFIDDADFTIYLCGFFWNASTGQGQIDSQQGTIIHELSHFSAIYGSQDFEYGTVDTLELAMTNPGQATRNADNLEYFAESDFTCNNSCGDSSCTGVEDSTCPADCVTPSLSYSTAESPASTNNSPVSTNNSPVSPVSTRDFSTDGSPSSDNSSSDRSNRSPQGDNSGSTTLTVASALAIVAAAIVLL